MAVVRDILLRFRETGLKEINRRYKEFFKSFPTPFRYGESQKFFSALDRSINELKKGRFSVVFGEPNVVDKLRLKYIQISKTFADWREQLKYVDLSFLSLLFAGLALQQMAVGLFRTFSSGWMNIVSDMNETKKSMTKLNASFEYMKFIIFDIFARSEFFMNLVNWLTRATEKIAEFAEQHPKLVEMIGKFVFFVGVIGTVMMALGMLLQTFYGLAAAVAFFMSPLGLLIAGLGLLALSSEDMATQMLVDFGVIGGAFSDLVDGIVENDSDRFINGLKGVFFAFIDLVFKAVGAFVKVVFMILDWVSERIADVYDMVAGLIENIPEPIKVSLGFGGFALASAARQMRMQAKFIRTTFNPEGVDEALKSVNDLLINKTGLANEYLSAKERELDLLDEEIRLQEKLLEIDMRRSEIRRRLYPADMVSRLGYDLSPEI